MRRTLIAIGLVVVGTGAAAIAQQAATSDGQRPVFRLGVNFVEVDAVVTDEQGQFVRDLTANDFEVLEDGVPQALSVISLVDIPVERDNRPLYRPTPVLPDVLTNEPGLEGRVYFLILDDLHVDATRTTVVRQMATTFVDQYVGANDVVAVIHIGQREANQTFTVSKPLMRRSIARFRGIKLPSRTLNKLADARREQEVPIGLQRPLLDTDSPVRLQRAGDVLRTLEGLSRYVERVQGRRKAFVFVSEGIDYNMDDPLTDSFSGLAVGTEVNTINGALRSMLESASRGNVSIYPVDPRGLTHELAQMTAAGKMPSNYLSDSVEDMAVAEFYGVRNVTRGLRDELDGSLDALRTLASETGGFAAINSNDLSGPFRRIVDDNSAYYLLGYYPTNDEANGTFRRVTVEVRQPGLQVRARRGYFARSATASSPAAPPAPEGPADRLSAAVSAPLATRGLAMRVVPQILRGPSGMARVHLAMELPPGAVPFDEADGVFSNDLMVTWSVLDADGAVKVTDTRDAALKLRPRTHRIVASHGISMIAEFDVPAGNYQLRVAGLEQSGGRAGSVIGDLEVPRFATATLAMSSLVVAARTEGLQFALSDGAGTLARLLPAPPTARRDFAADERLAVYAEIYDNDARPHSVDITVQVTAETGVVVFSSEDVRDGRDLASQTYGHLVALPLAQFTAGRYVLSVEARSRLGTTVRRETEITIR